MNVEELKEKARRHELREEWQKAFDLYSMALRSHDEEEPPDITLYNRVGDIQTRLGQINGAVERYEQAINLYLEAELPNNAIAICKKVLRNLPDRSIFFLRMGQIRASQGFLTDARQNFLAYAERETSKGEIENALNALIEFVEISPEDLEIRRSLASQLESHGRTEEAVEHYVEVHRRLLLAGDEEEAGSVKEKLAELAPDLTLPDADSLRQQAAEAESSDLILERTSLGGLEFQDWRDDDSEAPGIPVAQEGRTLDDSVAISPFSPEADEGEKEEESAEPLAREETDLPGSFDQPEDEDEGVEVLPEFDFDGIEEVDGLEGAKDAQEEEEDVPLPLIGFDEEGLEIGTQVGEETGEALEVGGLGEDLPFLTFDDEPEDEPGIGAESLEGAVEEAVFAGRVEEAARSGPVTEDASVVDDVDSLDHREAAERGDMDLALNRVRAQIELEPDNVELHQRLVEYAFRKNDPEILVGAYLALADCLARTSSPLKARAVYQQVMALSPGHEGASRGLQALDGMPGIKPPAQVASSEEYVDLGSLILGEDDEETTRWTVAADAPSGDEAADFAKMLTQFKEKVSEHVAADDVTAHHDLGTAYMEMGLFDEAIGEFQMALRASPTHLPTHEIMGRCWMEMGKSDMAVRALDRALRVPYEVEDELIGIYYLLGRAHEDQGNRSDALEFYEKVFSLDINFQDVTERLRALR